MYSNSSQVNNWGVTMEMETCTIEILSNIPQIYAKNHTRGIRVSYFVLKSNVDKFIGEYYFVTERVGKIYTY